MPPKVAVVILNWNGKSDTIECLESLSRDLYPNKVVIVVDNGSSDDSGSAIAGKFTGVQLVCAGKNLGFTGGNNVGLEKAVECNAEYVYFLNNDTTSDESAITRLVEVGESIGKFGILAPVMHYYTDDAVWYCGGKLELMRGIAVHDNNLSLPRDASPKTVDWVTGCAMFIPVSLMQSVGGFDGRYFLNWEDVDLSLRFTQMGLPLYVVPSARIRHKVSQSLHRIRSTALYYYVRNHLLFMSLHANLGTMATLKCVVQPRLREILSAAVRGDREAPRDFLRIVDAIMDHYRGRYGEYQRHAQPA